MGKSPFKQNDIQCKCCLLNAICCMLFSSGFIISYNFWLKILREKKNHFSRIDYVAIDILRWGNIMSHHVNKSMTLNCVSSNSISHFFFQFCLVRFSTKVVERVRIRVSGISTRQVFPYQGFHIDTFVFLKLIIYMFPIDVNLFTTLSMSFRLEFYTKNLNRSNKTNRSPWNWICTFKW